MNAAMRAVFRLTPFALAFVVGACKGEGAPNPAPVDEGSTTTGPGGGAPVDPPGPTQRTVELRNPLGNAAVGNLLVDGDFELSLTFEGSSQQVGWYVFSNSQGYLRMVTGGRCRSGLRCGLLPSGHVAFGRGTAAAKGGMIASIWAKPPPGETCDAVQPLAIRCSFSSQLTEGIDATRPEPDDDGWCFYRGRLRPAAEPICLYVQAGTFDGEAILDDARLIPDDGTAPLARQLTPSPPEQQRLRAIVDHLRDQTPIGNPPRFEPPAGR